MGGLFLGAIFPVIRIFIQSCVIAKHFWWLTIKRGFRKYIEIKIAFSKYERVSFIQKQMKWLLLKNSAHFICICNFNYHHFPGTFGASPWLSIEWDTDPKPTSTCITCTGSNQLERKGLMQHCWIFGGLKFNTMNYSFAALKWMWRESLYHSQSVQQLKRDSLAAGT